VTAAVGGIAVDIRPARTVDAEAVLRSWEEADAAPSVSDDVASVRRLIDHDPEALLVAELDGRIVGTVMATWDGWRGGIYRLAVAREHRRRGLGRQLVAAAEERFRRVGAPKISALVLHEHDHAVGFWRAIGYEHDDRIARWTRTLL
jgi:ribosomal protein S18 acetylase RimI-like enzyme